MSISAVVVSSSFRAQAYARTLISYAPESFKLTMHANLADSTAATLRSLDDATDAQQLDAANMLSAFNSRATTLCASPGANELAVIRDMIDACRTFNVDAGELIGEILVNR